MQNNTMQSAASLIARILLAAIFLWAGFGKVTDYVGTAAHMQKAGVPGQLLPLVIFVELVGGLLIVIGWQTRLVAFLLAGFTVLSALLFHFDLGDRGQTIHLLKNVAIAGGFLLLVANGAGAWSVEGHGRRRE